MKFTICLDKDDILTSKFHKHFIIQNGDISISFTREAMDELVKDYLEMKNGETTEVKIDGMLNVDKIKESLKLFTEEYVTPTINKEITKLIESTEHDQSTL